MKKTLAAAATGLLALTLVAGAPGQEKDKDQDHKVEICHFDGHESEVGNPDFAITGLGNGCRNQGGKVLSVSRNGAEHGHGVELDD